MPHNVRPRPLNNPKPARSKVVTLLAAFRCQIEGHPGVVICADSQETCGDYRIEVKKLEAKSLGNYELIRCGAGNTSELIDGQVRAIEQNIPRWPASLSEEEIRVKLENLLRGYNARHVLPFPAEPEDKKLKFVFCLRDKQSSNIYLWKASGTVILPVESYTLLGWEEAVYDYEVRRLYRPNLEAAQAILLGVHLFSVAQNSLYISRPTQVIVVHRDGIEPEDATYISDLGSRVESYDNALANIFLACPDTSMPREEFKKLLTDFWRYVTELREHYYGTVLGKELFRGFFDPNWKRNPVSRLPPDDIIDRTEEEEGKRLLSVKFTLSDPPDEPED